jgi:hypothetical protein
MRVFMTLVYHGVFRAPDGSRGGAGAPIVDRMNPASARWHARDAESLAGRLEAALRARATSRTPVELKSPGPEFRVSKEILERGRRTNATRPR